MIEDAPAGIRAGRAAGMIVIGLTSTYAAAELSEANLIIDSLRQLEIVESNGHIAINVSERRE